MTSSLRLSFIAAALLASASSASAGDYGCVGQCWRKEVSPPIYQTRHEQVLVREAQTVVHRIPARYATVRETVQVAPSRRGMQYGRDAYGREIMCEVQSPARYATVLRTVQTRPEGVAYSTIPAQYGTIARTEMVAPARAHWVPIRRGYDY